MTDWQPIETAPKDGRNVLSPNYGRDVLLFVPDGYCTKVFVGFFDYMDGWLTPEGGEIKIISGFPTHWMPLPEPPA